MSIKIIHFDRTTNTGKPKPRKDNWETKIVNAILIIAINITLLTINFNFIF